MPGGNFSFFNSSQVFLHEFPSRLAVAEPFLIWSTALQPAHHGIDQLPQGNNYETPKDRVNSSAKPKQTRAQPSVKQCHCRKHYHRLQHTIIKGISRPFIP